MVTKTVSQLVDDAIDSLPPLRRRLTKGYFRRKPEERDELESRMMLAISDDSDFEVSYADGMRSGAITASTPLQLDPAKVQQWIELFLKYLPIILKLFGL